MRVRNKKNLKTHNIYVVFIGLLPLLFIGAIGLPVLNMFNGMQQFEFDCGPPNPSTFLTSNYTQLSDMAYTYDMLFENYHIPCNQAIPISWDETFSTVEDYHGDDGDLLLWTGTALAAQACRYHAAKLDGNATEQESALRVVKKLVNGLSMNLAVPNGGLGSDYSAVLARYWGSPDYQEITPRLFDLENPPDPAEESFFNGTGIYSDYRYCGHTSNDQHAGFYLGIGMALEFVAEDDEEVSNLVTLMIDQICFNMIKNNFLVIDGNGNPNGADQKRSRILGDLFALTVLKLGAVALPEKYESTYYHYLITEQYIDTIIETCGLETLTSYYSLNFNFDCWLTILTLEKDPVLKAELFNIFESKIYNTVKYHRNAWFNVIYLSAKSEVDELILGDVEDQLMRFNLTHYPDRRYSALELPIGDNPGEYQFIEGPRIYNDFFSDSPYGGFYALFFSDIGLVEEKLHVNKPLTVEYRKLENFMWQRSPFRYSYPDTSSETFEETGISYTAPYWVARAFNLIPSSGMGS